MAQDAAKSQKAAREARRPEKVGWQEIELREEGTTQLEELIAWMEGSNKEHRSSGRQARYAVEIIMAIYESLKMKGLVRMPLKTKESPLEMMINNGTLPVETPGKYDIRVPFRSIDKV